MAFPSAEDWLAERGLRMAKSLPPAKQLESSTSLVGEAVLFIRRSTARNPQSTQRIREKLLARGYSHECVDEAIDVATQSRDLDDVALATALVKSWFERGHATRRIAHDLKNRGFADAEVRSVLALQGSRHDPCAAAFAVAMMRAPALLAVPPDTALRRLMGHVERRGYSSAVASKAARDALYAAREQIHSAEA